MSLAMLSILPLLLVLLDLFIHIALFLPGDETLGLLLFDPHGLNHSSPGVDHLFSLIIEVGNFRILLLTQIFRSLLREF